MPFIPHTPESLVKRSDSKDPATTCKGITTGGRHCRRDIKSPQPSPTRKRTSKTGVVAFLAASDLDDDGTAAYFCWQHKDQAESLLKQDNNGKRPHLIPVQQRTSIDTLAERLGIIDLEDNMANKERRMRAAKPARKQTLPRKWQEANGLSAGRTRPTESASAQTSLRPKEKPKQALFLFCCIKPADSDPMPPSRPRLYAEKPTRVQISTQGGQNPHNVPASREALRERGDNPTTPAYYNVPSKTGRPVLGRDPPSQTQEFLALIPPVLSPQVTSSLLAELAKPISPLDELGYIYMFWLTNTAEVPDEDTASSLLGDIGHSSPLARQQRNALQRYASVKDPRAGTANASTVLLKIGRAANVQRRMNQWTRQCGYDLSLIRYYPYQPTPSTNSVKPPTSRPRPQQVPHSHKVERLIHIELADKRNKQACEFCKKEHREWFEVEANRSGLKYVDEVIRRWITWDQRKDTGLNG
ncbi:MAG: hypothetical protein Q9163_001913 [Psora crenata]